MGSKQMWLINGDRNTTYFHTLVRQRKAKNTVTRIKQGDGSWIDDYDELERAAGNFFSNIFKHFDTSSQNSEMTWL